jgi:hypothetical protein
MHLDIRRLLSIALLAVLLSACSTSTGTINTPIGKIQLGMYIEDVEDVLGPGTVLESERLEGEFRVQRKGYASADGRTYVVYYVDDIVRRWELREDSASAEQTQ